jgi:hypothetical protein
MSARRAPARKSLLSVSRADVAALVSMTMGRAPAASVRYATRFESDPHRDVVPEAAWHPATRLTTNGRSGGDDRGSAEDRRRRKRYLLDTYGDGQTCPCAFCKAELTYDTVTVDRFPIPGRAGGRYTRDNIRPACSPCNKEDQGRAAMLALTGATS